MFGWFSGKKEVQRVEEDTKKSFEFVKKDIDSVSGWIRHLDSEKNLQKKELAEIIGVLSSVKDDLEEMKKVLSMVGGIGAGELFNKNRQVFKQQTGVYAVQTGVQTGVQTPNLEQFSTTEKAIIWILLNAEMKLGYEDLAAILNKEKSTIRGQINRIKQKSEIIEEIIEKNGKKRVYIPENIKDKMLKKKKVRVNKSKVDQETIFKKVVESKK
ncbi:MAG: hypothetical protein ABIA78_00025 [archaeon]